MKLILHFCTFVITGRGRHGRQPPQRRRVCRSPQRIGKLFCENFSRDERGNHSGNFAPAKQLYILTSCQFTINDKLTKKKCSLESVVMTKHKLTGRW